jgi:hypothetical protein
MAGLLSRVLGGFAGRVGLSRNHAVGADVRRSQMLQGTGLSATAAGQHKLAWIFARK